MRIALVFLLLAVPCTVTAQTPPAEATSLLGKPLLPAPPTGETKIRLETDLAKAQADYDRDPASADTAIATRDKRPRAIVAPTTATGPIRVSTGTSRAPGTFAAAR